MNQKYFTYYCQVIKSIILFIFIGIFSVQGQQKALYFNLYTIENGLSQNSIKSIVQDRHGFIWLATESGLNQFDGYKFKKWYQEQGNKNSIASGFINDLAIDKNNYIWIATTSGISCYDSKIDKFNSFGFEKDNKESLSDNLVYCVFVDSDNYLWAGTKNGLNRSKRAIQKQITKGSTIKFIRYFNQKFANSISNNEISCISEDWEHNIWIGTKNGLNRYNKKTNSFDVYFFSLYNSGQNGANEINAVKQINDSTIWVATNGGLFELNTKSKFSFSFNGHNFFKKNKISGSIRSLLLDSKGDVWIGTFGNGLLHYKATENRFYQYKKQVGDKNQPIDNFIISLFEDKSGTLFIGTYGKGLNTTKVLGNYFELFRHVENDNNSLSENITRHISYQDKNSVWMGTLSKGLERFNIQTKKITHYPFKKLRKNNAPVTIQFILPKNNDELWIGTLGAGLLLYNHTTNTYKQYLHTKNKNSISDNYIYWLTKQTDSLLWIGTFGSGLDVLNIKTGKFEHYDVNPKDKGKLSHGLLTYLEFDKNGALWIASWGGGLMKFNTRTKKIKHFRHFAGNRSSISADFVITMYFDKKGNIWIGTSAGLNKYNPKTNQFTYFGKKDGFSDEFINSIEQDEHENLWIGTNRGIIKFNTISETVINFDVKDGLQDYEFSSGINLKLPDGRMIFGGINGFNLFHPDSIKLETFEPNIAITEFQLFYKKVELGVKYKNNFQLKKTIMNTDTIILNYKNNIIGFEFAALDFTKPNNIKYAFRLKGFEKNWNHTDKNERFARYTNLKYGNYVLQIKSTNGYGLWNSKTKEVVIIINAPFWLTTEFWFVFILIILLIFVSIYRLRVRILQQQKQKLENQVKERTKEISHKNIELKDQYEEIVVKEEEIREQAEELRVISAKLEKSNIILSEKVNERTIELENALSKAEDAQKLISSFLSNLSHEIRTPMNAIMGFSQIIGSMELSESKKNYYAGIIEQNVLNLLTQIDNIMNVAKLHTGQYQFKNELFSLSELLKSIYNELNISTEIATKDISLEICTNNTQIQLYSDLAVFKNIIVNLVQNAIKYTEKGFVEFGFEIKPLGYNENRSFKVCANSAIELILFVNDSGIGIAEKEQKIIFDAFRKVESGKQKLYRGTGLGLALVKSLTDRLNGSIIVNSKIEKGTKILIKIPISEI